MFLLTPELAAEYASRTAKTVSRDLNVLLEKRLIRRVRGGYVAAKEEIRAFLPTRRQPTNGNEIEPPQEIDIEKEEAEGSDREPQLAIL
jgi:DeoR/GlpR family transcriptional regulator of sugar metabolism